MDFRHLVLGGKRAAALTVGITLSAVLAASPATAQCVPDNPAINGTVVCSGIDNDGFIDGDDGLTITVEPGAQVNNGGRAIDAQGDNHTITNDGSIVSTGNDGIRVDNGTTITNNGTIVADDEGIEVDNNNVIINNGFLSGSRGEAIEAEDNNRIVNTGTIINVGNDDAIEADDNTTVINSGSIISTDVNASDQAVDINSGTIVNSGLIQGFEAIEVDRGAGVIINSGTIIGFGGSAIDFDDANEADTLVLQPGSIIQGTINFRGGTDTLVVENGLSISNTFLNGPEIINANGAPFAVNGNQVAVLDPTSLSQQDEMLADLTSGIFNSVHARLAGAGGASSSGFGGMALGMSSMMQLGGGSKMNLSTQDVGPTASGEGTGVWAQAFGGNRNVDANGPSVATDHQYFGGIAGVDGWLTPGLRVGAFAGAARAEVEFSFDSQDLEADSFYGGGYASLQKSNWFAHLMLTAGRSDYDSTRQVANNLVATGLQTATANYDGTFFSPELTAGSAINIGGLTIEPSARIRYAHLSLDGFLETGAADNLSIGGRDVSLWQGRVQLAVPFSSEHGTLAPRIGVEAWTSNSDTISAVLIGQAISFDPGGENDEVTGFVGATATAGLGVGASLFLDGEMHIGGDGYSRTEARAGFMVNF